MNCGSIPMQNGDRPTTRVIPEKKLHFGGIKMDCVNIHLLAFTQGIDHNFPLCHGHNILNVKGTSSICQGHDLNMSGPKCFSIFNLSLTVDYDYKHNLEELSSSRHLLIQSQFISST